MQPRNYQDAWRHDPQRQEEERSASDRSYDERTRGQYGNYGLRDDDRGPPGSSYQRGGAQGGWRGAYPSGNYPGSGSYGSGYPGGGYSGGGWNEDEAVHGSSDAANWGHMGSGSGSWRDESRSDNRYRGGGYGSWGSMGGERRRAGSRGMGPSGFGGPGVQGGPSSYGDDFGAGAGQRQRYGRGYAGAEEGSRGSQAYESGGYGGYGGSAYGEERQLQGYDPDYERWRYEQMCRLDDDYNNYRQEHYRKFSDEFNHWRTNRQQGASARQDAVRGTSDSTSAMGGESGRDRKDGAEHASSSGSSPGSSAGAGASAKHNK